ncbi:MAG: PKD domain-containing protein, partial [Bacteroidales bacterium]
MDFGDENQSSEVNPTHTYSYSGAYNVKLSIQNEQCSKSDYFEKIVNIDNVGFHDPNSFEFSISPNPV